MKPDRSPEQLAQLFADVFEADKRGAAVLEHLIARFMAAPRGEGLDRLVNMVETQGRRQVLDYILHQINRAHGVDDGPASTDEA